MNLKHQGKSPNVVLIILDTTRARNLSCYGYQRETSPVIDALADEGVVFEQAIAPSLWTLPSHASIFTGRYPSSHRTNTVRSFLEPSMPTMAEFLSSVGYQTLGFSKIHFVSRKTGLARGFQDFYEIWKLNPQRDSHVFADKVYRKVFDHLYDDGARRINAKLNQWFSDSYQEEKPFFLFINYFEPHLDFWAPSEFRFKFLEKELHREAKSVNQNSSAYNARKTAMDEKDFEILRALYDGEIAYADYRVSEVVKLLKARGQFENTIFIVAADHGESIGEHSLMEHRYCPYDTTVHVPLMIRYPDVFPRGKRVKEIVQTIDIFPTIVDILGHSGKVDIPFEGSVLPPLREAKRDYTITECVEPRPPEKFIRRNPQLDPSVFMRKFLIVRTDAQKLIWSSDKGYEYYDLKKDPLEQKDLGIPEGDAVFKHLLEVSQSWLKKWDQSGKSENTIDIDKEMQKRLEALGYM